MEKLIIDNDRDKRAAEWLIKTVGEEAVINAIGKLSGNRKPYISNVAKVLGVEIPKEVILTPQTEAKKHLSNMLKMLNQINK